MLENPFSRSLNDSQMKPTMRDDNDDDGNDGNDGNDDNDGVDDDDGDDNDELEFCSQ